MGMYVANEVIKLMVKADKKIKKANVLVLGITFKENCPDVRNTKVVDVIRQLKDFGTQVTIYDPWAKPEEVNHEYNLKTTQEIPEGTFDAIILTVAHHEFLDLDLELLKNGNAPVYDVKGVLAEKANSKL